jgi:streptomycin 6-kinase
LFTAPTRKPGSIGSTRSSRAALNRTIGEPRSIHGDLHFNAILASDRRPWLAIDPRGTIGDPAFDAGMVVADPSDRITLAPRPMRALAQRLTFLPDLLGLSRERVAGYGFAQTVLIACAVPRDLGQGHEVARGMARALGRLIFKDMSPRTES